MFYALFLALSPATAGDLEVVVTAADQAKTLRVEQLAACSTMKVHLDDEDRWSIEALASGREDGAIYVELDVRVELVQGKAVRRLESRPTLILRDGEPGRLTVGDLHLEVTAEAFEVDASCIPRTR